MRVLCLSKRWNHHTASGGYDRLVTEVGAQEVRRVLLPKVVSRVLQKAGALIKLFPARNLDYRYEDLCAEKELLAKAQETQPDLVHVLYGDEQLSYLLETKDRLPCPLLVSYHLPTFRAADRLNSTPPKLLARITAVVVLATYQLQDYRAWFRPDQLFYVPHGIDTARFCPNPQRKSTPGTIQLATVGTHMRDWKAIECIVQSFEKRNLPVRFSVVDSYGHCLFLKKYKCVDLLTGLTEDELVQLYQNADALLLPVTSATANNSALESMACGTPVISTDVDGIPDYVDNASGWLFPKDEVDGIVTLIEAALADPAVFTAKREGARHKALEFSWDKVAKQMHEVYKTVVSKAASVAVG